MNIIINNPNRILGVFTNARRREIIANKRKATAFLNTGRNVDFPLDINGLLTPLQRTVIMINEAEAHLVIAKEQIKYAQFWFLKLSLLDDIAFNHLLAGNMAGAIEIWSKQETLSSLQNKLVCYLIEGKQELAIKTAERLYEKYGDEYINKVDANCTLHATGTELLHQFIDSLGEEIGMQKLLDFNLGADTKAYICSQTIGPLINKISSEVEKAKKVDHKDPKARIEAGRRLEANTKEAFSHLKSILPATDSQYQMIADKLGLEILQCGIDYFNNTEDDDAPHIAMEMQKYAQSVVVGSLAKQRCDENVKILQKIIDSLPPMEVMAEYKAIKENLNNYDRLPKKIIHAINLLNRTKPHLQSIKQELGIKNTFYLKLSTLVVCQALHGVVVEVNASQKPIQENDGLMEHVLSPYYITHEQRKEISAQIKNAVSNAWDVFVIMDDFDLEPNFKHHYYQNRKTIKSMCEQYGIETLRKPLLPEGRFADYGGFWNYIKSTKSSRWQAALVIQILCMVISYWLYSINNSYNKDIYAYIWGGLGIGACAWLCILYDNDDRYFNTSNLEQGGCVGLLLIIVLFVFYWIYKCVRIVIDKIKRA